MNAYAQFGSERSFALSSAILLYSETGNRHQTSGSALSAATIHPVTVTGGGGRAQAPALGVGTPVTVASLESLMTALGHGLETELLPERLLALSLTRMIWWTPARRERIWFKPATRSVALDAALKKLNGKVVAHPHLLFCANYSQFQVFALAKGERPALTTKLYRAPYFNLSENGLMCAGSANLPSIASPAFIPKFEAGFFNSAFSHSNWGHQLTKHPEGHAGLWKEMAVRKDFDPKHLVGTPYTVGGLLKRKASHD